MTWKELINCDFCLKRGSCKVINDFVIVCQNFEFINELKPEWEKACKDITF